MASEKDVLKALAEEVLQTNPHPDRANVLREFVDADEQEQDAPTHEGQGSGGDSKPDTEEQTPTTTTTTGATRKAGK